MAPGTIEQVRTLRQQIPVGYAEGLATLTACDGNIGNAVILLQQQYITVVAKATKLQADTILPLLIRNQYDTTQTIQQLEETHRLVNGVPQRETAYILHRWQAHKEHAVQVIADGLAQHLQLNRLDNDRHDLHHFSWYVEEELRNLAPIHRCVIALTDWLEYAYWEGFDDAINYYPDLMATELQRLELPELAAALITARQERETIRKQYPENTLKAYIAYSNECNQHKNYQQAEAYLDTHQPLIFERLFDWIGSHATQFP